MGERWSKIEERFTQRIQEAEKRKCLRIRSSPQMIAVAEMILAGEKAMDICRFLRIHDPELFSAKVSDDALLKQVLRFKEFVTEALEEGEEDEFPTSRLDFYARLRGKHLDVKSMLRKLVLYQETRLDLALKEEGQQLRASAKLSSTSDGKVAEQEMKKIFSTGSEQLGLYWKFLMSYAIYEALERAVSHESRTDIHQIWRANRQYFP